MCVMVVYASVSLMGGGCSVTYIFSLFGYFYLADSDISVDLSLLARTGWF